MSSMIPRSYASAALVLLALLEELSDRLASSQGLDNDVLHGLISLGRCCFQIFVDLIRNPYDKLFHGEKNSITTIKRRKGIIAYFAIGGVVLFLVLSSLPAGSRDRLQRFADAVPPCLPRRKRGLGEHRRNLLECNQDKLHGIAGKAVSIPAIVAQSVFPRALSVAPLPPCLPVDRVQPSHEQSKGRVSRPPLSLRRVFDRDCPFFLA